ncbi:MAG: uracil-DNA glycosylase family protein, partial [Flavobacteriales bacterium]
MLADRLLQHVLSFSLKDYDLPRGVGVLDPFNGDHGEEVRRIVTTFHHRFFHDDQPRVLLLGINPGRLGAGSTGLPFTDTKRCESDLGIAVNGLRTHEPSSDFFYRMVRAAGGAEAFYSRVYVHAICPLGFV